MRIKLWGVRGSIPTPLSTQKYRENLYLVLRRAILNNITTEQAIGDFIKGLPNHLNSVFGGNTTCVTLTSKSGKNYIIDCGTGLRHLGNKLMSGPAGKGRAEIKIFLTHTHWDHIQGLPFFKPIYIPGNTLHFYSPISDIEERLEFQQDNRFFPVHLNQMAATKIFHHMKSPLQLEDSLIVDFFSLKHPGESYAFRFRENNSTFIIATDAEFSGDYIEEPGNPTDFFSDADLLILDAQYTLDESFTKFDWGHTSYTMAVNCGLRWNVKNLVLTHHEPGYTDRYLQAIKRDAIRHRAKMKNRNPKIFMAREGMVFSLGEQ